MEKRKFLKGISQIEHVMRILPLVALFIVVSGSNCFADKVLAVPETIQEHSNWCWAGSSKAVLAYYKKTPSQCEIADWAWGRSDCCGNSTFSWSHTCNQANYMYGGGGSLQDILTNWGVNSTLIYDSLAQSTARSEIDAGRPFVMRFGWKSGGGHFLVGRGISGSNLYYMDPWPGNGYTISDYSWVVSSSEHTWTDTLKITTAGDISPPKLAVTSHQNNTQVYTSSITLGGTASDADEGGDGIQEVMVNGVRANNDTATGDGTADWTATVELTQPVNVITIIASDDSANHNQASETITIYYYDLDRTFPAINFLLLSE